jgi:hypothetical protein
MTNYYEKYLKYKKKYLNYKNLNLEGGTIAGSAGTDTGAGVFLIENYRNNANTRTEDAVILFKSRHSYRYEEGGGGRDPGEDLRKTATRELKEESLNTFRLDHNILRNQDAYRHQTYVGYFVKVRGPAPGHGIASEDYNHNLGRINHYHQQLGQEVPHDWRETNRMVRVYINDLIQGAGTPGGQNIHNVAGNMSVNDANGNKITIDGRTKALLRMAICGHGSTHPGTNHIPNLQPHTLNLNNNYQPHAGQNQPFLNGTRVYWI